MSGARASGAVVAVCRPHHGLGNRVRLLLSARELAERHGRSFSYVWPTGRMFGARFDELWRSDLSPSSTLRAQLSRPRHPYRDAALGWLEQAANDPLWQIRSAQPVALPGGAAAWRHRMQALVPVDVIADRVRSVHGRHLQRAPYIGVMVRAHAVSHERTRNESPLQWYLERMAAIRADRPDVRFFVSADTSAAERAVRSAFPDAVGLGDKGTYNSREALSGAVADLYLLAASSHIIGPHYSSFPELAVFLAGAAVRLETSKADAPHRLAPSDALTRADDPLRPFERVAA